MDRTVSEAAGEKQVRIFFCYAREDELLLNQLKNHLQPLQRQGLIKLWSDREIRAGSEWEPPIKKQLDMAQIILLLVSPDFLASDYCYSIEMQHALERHQRGETIVIPIILRPVYWYGGPLGRLQALPTDGKPVTDSYWHDPDGAFFDITKGIYQVIEKLTAASPIVSPTGTINERQLETAKPENTPPHILQRENSAPIGEPPVICDGPPPPVTDQLALLGTLTGRDFWCVAISPDWKTLVSAAGDGTIQVWNLASGQEIRNWKSQSRIISMAISPDGKTCVGGAEDETIKAWSLVTGREIGTLRGHRDRVLSVAISPNGEILVSGSTEIKVWNLSTGQEIRTLPESRGFMYRLRSPVIYCVAISPDGKTLVSGESKGRITIWNLATGQEIRILTGHTTHPVTSVAISPDGETLGSATDEEIKVWDLATGQEIRTINGDSVIAISLNGETLIGADSRVIKIWNLATGQEIRTLIYAIGNWQVAISPNGETLVGVSSPEINVWRV